jgi:prepilin-type N-terminal cleavage/methylation domain-containing protein
VSRRKKCRRPLSGGFTLIETLVALSLLSILTGMAYAFYTFVHKQVLVRENKAFEFDDTFALMQAVSANIRQCRATLMLDPSQWVFISKNGDTASYVFSGDTLKFNAVPISVAGKSVARFSFSCSGSDTTLDVNADGKISFEELDRNSDGKIDGPETQDIAWIKASVSFQTNPEKTIETIEEVKNNLEYDEAGYQTYFKE